MKKVNIIIIAVVAAILAGIVALLVIDKGEAEQKRKDLCMGIGFIAEEDVVKYDYYGKYDFEKLTYNGQPVPFDRKSWTIYISQSPDNIGNYYDLTGELEWSDPSSTAQFIKNEALENLEESVRNNVPLSLYITNGKTYRIVKVVITTLPVMNMEGKVSYKNEDDRDVLKGNVTLWTGKDPVTGKSNMQTSELEWHVRGHYSAGQPKKPWKLSLKDENGLNNHLDFLGMGADDDWILNCLTMDDTRIKEKLMMDYWNILAAREDHLYKMSTGEYVEVVINDQYMGLFLLQRRVDGKYLELGDNDVLLKAVNYGLTKAEDAYEFITDPVNEKQIYSTMQKVLDQKDSSMYNLENMVDTNLMLQFTSSVDNQGLKNIYHVLVKKGNSYEHYLIPWDTDQSMGVVWSASKKDFDYDANRSVKERVIRKETNAMIKARPDYYELEAARWLELRESLIIEENILKDIDALYTELSECGAFARDTDLWGMRYGKEDTIDALKLFFCDRLEYLDRYYKNALWTKSES